MKAIKSDIDKMKSQPALTGPQSAQSLADIELRFSEFSINVLNYLKEISTSMLTVTNRMDNLEQYSRRNCLLVHGIAEERNEDCEQVLLKLFTEKMNVTGVERRDFDRAHRLGVMKPNRARPIIIKFVSYGPRRAIFAAKKALKGTKITITEQLTKERMKVLSAARARIGVTQVWTQDGTIIALVNDTKYRITTLSELANIPEPYKKPLTRSNSQRT